MSTLKAAFAVLEKAYALIRSKKRWCQGPQAKTEDGQFAGATAPDACQWCAIGAIWKYAPVDSLRAERAAEMLSCASRALFDNPSFVFINETGGHAATLSVYRRAIRDAKRQLKAVTA